MIARLRPMLGWREFAALVTPPAPDEVRRFEREFAELMGRRHAVSFPYGRTGIALLLEAMGLRDREIICPTYTCVVVAHAIVTSGNEPVFLDSRDHDFNMNLALVPEAIGPKTGAIMATSIFGYPVDLDALDKIRAEHPGVAIIQDCAHSFSAAWRGRPVQREGTAAIFGLNISKLMTSIFGGMVTTDDDALAARLCDVRDRRLHRPGWTKAWLRRAYLAAIYPAFTGPVYGLTNRLERSGVLARFTQYYDEGVIDMPADHLEHMTPVEARVGRAQVRRFPEIVAHRRAIAAYYNDRLADVPGLRLPPEVDGATFSHYVPRVARGERAQILAHGLRHGVQLGELIEYSVADMAAYKDRPANRFDCPVAREMAETTINLPLWVSRRGAEKVARVLEEAMRG